MPEEFYLNEKSSLFVVWGSDSVTVTEILEDGDDPGSATSIEMTHESARRLHQFIMSSLMKRDK